LSRSCFFYNLRGGCGARCLRGLGFQEGIKLGFLLLDGSCRWRRRSHRLSGLDLE
jgi:hypothetical protein